MIFVTALQNTCLMELLLPVVHYSYLEVSLLALDFVQSYSEVLHILQDYHQYAELLQMTLDCYFLFFLFTCFPPLPMKQNTTLLVLGLALAITGALAVAPILSEMAYAASSSGSGGSSTPGMSGNKGGAGGKGDNF